MADVPTSLTLEFGPLLTSTQIKVLGSGALHDNVFTGTPTWSKLHGSGRVKVVDGGESMRIPILYGKNTTFKWYADYEPLLVTPQTGMTIARFTWKQGAASVVINGKELRANRGSLTKLANLLEEKNRQTKESLIDGMATGLFSDGTGTASKQMTGLTAAIATDPTTGTYGAINSATNDKWRNRIQTNVGAAATALLPKLRNVVNSAMLGAQGADSKPDMIVMPQNIHEAFEALLFPQVRYGPNPSGGADAGIEVLKFKGIEVFWDPYCTSGVVYVLNSNHLMVFVHSDANLKMTEAGFQQPVDQDALMAQILFMGNVAVNNRRKLGKLTGVTA